MRTARENIARKTDKDSISRILSKRIFYFHSLSESKKRQHSTYKKLRLTSRKDERREKECKQAVADAILHYVKRILFVFRWRPKALSNIRKSTIKSFTKKLKR